MSDLFDYLKSTGVVFEWDEDPDYVICHSCPFEAKFVPEGECLIRWEKKEPYRYHCSVCGLSGDMMTIGHESRHLVKDPRKKRLVKEESSTIKNQRIQFEKGV